MVNNLFKRRKRKPDLQESCPLCHNIIPNEKQFCEYCGVNLRTYKPEVHEGDRELVNCPKCHQLIDKNSISCKFCKINLKICKICNNFIGEDEPMLICPFCNSEFHLLEYFLERGWQKKCPICKRKIKDISAVLKNIKPEGKEEFEKLEKKQDKYLKIFIIIILLIVGFSIFAIIWKFLLTQPELNEDLIFSLLKFYYENQSP